MVLLLLYNKVHQAEACNVNRPANGWRLAIEYPLPHVSCSKGSIHVPPPFPPALNCKPSPHSCSGTNLSSSQTIPYDGEEGRSNITGHGKVLSLVPPNRHPTHENRRSYTVQHRETLGKLQRGSLFDASSYYHILHEINLT
jgi:hypothetical protein